MPKIKVDEAEYERLLKIEAQVKKLFASVDREGLFLGAGYDQRLEESEQEGRIVKRLRKLVEADRDSQA